MADPVKPDPPALGRFLVRSLTSTAAVFLLAYAVLFIRFHTGSVTLSRNVASEWNARALAIPEEQRAWTHYRRIWLAMEPLEGPVGDAWGDLAPGDELWPQAAAYLERNAKHLEALRRATELPNLGVFYTTEPDMALSLDGDRSLPMPGPAADNPWAMELLMPQLGKSRYFARAMKMDLWHAAEAQDNARAADDLCSLLRLARQNLGEKTVIEQLTGFAVVAFTCQTCAEAIVRYPDLLNEAQWAAIELELTRTLPCTQLSFPAELALVADVEQRLFTEDGDGEGRVCFQSLQNQSHWLEFPTPPSVLNSLGAPIFHLGESRATFREFAQKIYHTAAEQASLHRVERTLDPDRIVSSIIPKDRRRSFEGLCVAHLMPDFDKALDAQDQIGVHLGAARTLTALVRHRLRHGSYPQALDALDADLRPTPQPLDCYDNQPLRYRLVEGWPVIYSVGTNLADDGGVPPSPPHRPDDAFAVREGVDGDWILFPPVGANRDRLITTPGPWPAERRAPSPAR